MKINWRLVPEQRDRANKAIAAVKKQALKISRLPKNGNAADVNRAQRAVERLNKLNVKASESLCNGILY